MKISDAIRLGSMLGPQCFGVLEEFGGTCALGAAYKAAGLQMELDSLHNFVLIEQTFPLLYRAWHIACPDCQRIQQDLGNAIAHLNDRHAWTRERIADWVQALEAIEEPSCAPMTSTPTNR